MPRFANLDGGTIDATARPTAKVLCPVTPTPSMAFGAVGVAAGVAASSGFGSSLGTACGGFGSFSAGVAGSGFAGVAASGFGGGFGGQPTVPFPAAVPFGAAALPLDNGASAANTAIVEVPAPPAGPAAPRAGAAAPRAGPSPQQPARTLRSRTRALEEEAMPRRSDRIRVKLEAMRSQPWRNDKIQKAGFYAEANLQRLAWKGTGSSSDPIHIDL